MFDLAGTELGKYRLQERIGKGGMSVVYRAYQPGLERHVAIKILLPHLAESQDFIRRFRREAQAVSSLRHPNIVQVFDFDYDQQRDLYYMVMEHLEGETLKARLARLGRAEGRMPPAQVLGFFEGLLSGVGYAHALGMVHRDLKPANIMFDRGERPVLTDFGIAMIVGGERFTVTGAVMGTPVYMAPEQGLGEPGEQRTDLYALGVVLFESLTGQVPFDADTPYAIMNKHIHQPIPALRQLAPDLPDALEPVVNKALAKVPSERFQTASEMWAALADARETIRTGNMAEVFATPARPLLSAASRLPLESSPDPLSTPLVSITPAGSPSRRRRNVRVFSFAGAFLAVALLGAGWLLFGRSLWPRNTTALVAQGQAQLAQDDPTAALTAFEQVLDSQPDNVEALLGRAEALVALGQPDVALDALDEAVQAAPDSPDVYVARGRYGLLYTSGPDVDEALADFDQAIELDPASASAYLARGWAILNFQQDATGALPDLREAVRLAPGDPEAHRQLAHALAGTGDLEGALGEMRAALVFAADDPEYQIDSALILRQAGDLGGAVAALDSALALSPDSPAYHAMRAYLHFEQSDFDAALADSNEALRLDPNNAAALYTRGITNYQLHNYLDALSDLDAVQSHEPFEYTWPFLSAGNLREINLDRALVLQALPGRESEALSAFDASAAAKPDWFAPYYYRGLFQADRGDAEAARADLERALELVTDQTWRNRVDAALVQLQ